MSVQEQVPVEVKQEANEQELRISQAMGKLMLASIGAVALTQEALENMLNRMVARGELSRKEARRRMQELRAKRPDLSRRGVHNLSGTIRDAAELPSKSDIQGLHDQLAALTAKVEELSKEKSAPAAPPPPKTATKP